jgi:hypothetical protein
MAKINDPCSIDGCGSPRLARGLCTKHYQRRYRTGSVDIPERSMCRCGMRWARYPDLSGEMVCRPCLRGERLASEDERREPGACLQCGEEFAGERRYSEESGRGIFCSRACKEMYRRQSGRVAAASRKHYYRSKYGLTIAQVEAMRDGGCSVCGTSQSEGRWGNLHIDHDHATGRVRGVLCNECNFGLGKFKDSPALLRAAAEYLERAEAVASS